MLRVVGITHLPLFSSLTIEVIIMRWFYALPVAALLLFVSPHAEAAKGQKAKKATTVKGTVVSVSTDKGKSITIKTTGKGKKAAEAGQEKTFKLTEKAPVTKVTGKKADKQESPGQLSEATPGSTVAVTTKGDTAESLKILKVKKVKKAKKTKKP